MSSAPQKRVRKRSKRLSESEHILEEPPKKKLKRNGKQSGSSGGRGGRVSASSKTSIREKGEKERHRPRKLLVSLNFVQNNLRLNNVPLAETKNGSAGRTEEGSNGSNGDGVLPRRSVQIKFKDPNFTFSYLASNKKKTWKNLKQIISLERSLLTRPDDPTCE